MNDEQIKEMIRLHEGYVPSVYLDTVKVPTAGYGHAFHLGSKIPHKVAELLFEQDFDGVKKDYDIITANHGGLVLDPVRRAVLMDMLFNMGLLRVSQFKKMFRALRRGDYETASEEMLDSKWANQVGIRAVELAEMMKTGESDV